MEKLVILPSLRDLFKVALVRGRDRDLNPRPLDHEPFAQPLPNISHDNSTCQEQPQFIKTCNRQTIDLGILRVWSWY